MPTKSDVRDLYQRLSQAYEMGGQTEKALVIAVERERLELG
jgi:hypothetical protein